jgi:hypothetical protein
MSLPARGRPLEAAARRAGLEFVEKLLTTNLTSADTTERMLACFASCSAASLVERPLPNGLSTQRGSGRRGLSQESQAQIQALVADPSVLAELAARRRRQPAGNQEHSLPPVLAAEAAPGLRPPLLQP